MVDLTLTLGDAVLIFAVVLLAQAVAAAVAFALGYYYLTDAVERLIMPPETQDADALVGGMSAGGTGSVGMNLDIGPEDVNTDPDEYPPPVGDDEQDDDQEDTDE